MRAGFARQDITPGREMDLLGYAWRQDRMPPGNDGVLDPLSARVLVLEEGERRAVLVSLDLCIVSVALGRRLRERAAAAAGAQVDDVLLACTHTHSGPWIREKELDGALFPASPSCRVEVEDEASERYLDLLEERLTVAAAGAAGCTVPVSAAWRSCPLGLGYRRRVLVDGAVQHCWNPVQQTVLRPEPMADPTLSVLVLRELAGPAGWVLWGHGSHPVVLGQASRRVSADWPGRANDLIAEWLPGFESLFVLGAAGDVHPWVATQPRPEGVEVVARAAAAQVALLARAVGDGDRNPALAVASRTERIGRADLPLTAWRIGGLRLAASPVELFNGLGLDLRRRVAGDLLVATNCNGWTGYWPDAQATAEGGYEVGQHDAWGRTPGDGERLVGLLAELAGGI